MPRPTFKDASLSSINGFVGLGAHALLSLLLLFGQVLWAFAWPVAILLNVGGGILWFLMWNSYVIVNPNEAVVTQFFGKYVGTLKHTVICGRDVLHTSKCYLHTAAYARIRVPTPP